MSASKSNSANKAQSRPSHITRVVAKERSGIVVSEARALEHRLTRLLGRIAESNAVEDRLKELLQQQAARAAEVRALESAVERLLGHLGAILTATTRPPPASVEIPATPPSCSAPPPAYWSFPPPQPQRRIDMSGSPLGQWLIACRKRMHYGRVRP